jgi:hypothetical protein
MRFFRQKCLKTPANTRLFALKDNTMPYAPLPFFPFRESSQRRIRLPFAGFTFALSISLACPLPAASGPTATDTIAEWKRFVSSGFAIPEGETASAKASALLALLAQPQPQLRDDVAYETLARWLHHANRPDDATRRHMFGVLLQRMEQHAEVTARSFAALTLKELMATDLSGALFTADEVSRAARANATGITRETDPRGFTTETGWVHVLAHQADLARILFRHPKLTDADAALLNSALIRRVQTQSTAWEWGEDARIAHALAWAAQRPDSHAAMRTWLEQLVAARNRFWQGPFARAGYVQLRAQTSVLAAWLARMGTMKPSEGTAPLVAAAAQAFQRVD